MNRRFFLASLLTTPWLARADKPPASFVVHPYDTPSRIYVRFRPLTIYLGSVLGHPVQLVIARTYDEQIAMIASGRADYAYMGPTPYVQARARGQVEILAGESEGGQAFYQSALVVRDDSAIRSIADLAGKRLALGAEISLGSAIVPRLMLAQAGIRRADLALITHLERHERVALAVLHGDFDVGGVRLDIARTYLPRGLRVLATSQPLPPHVVAASARVSLGDTGRVRDALLNPTPDGRAAFQALGPHVGFVAVDDSHYNAVRRMMRTLENW